jgi:hypothetical protein
VTPHAGAVGVALVAALALSSCAETVIEVEAVPTPAGVDGRTTAATSTTLPIDGPAAELLPELAVEMSRLSSQIAADGDERATLRRIEALWAAAEAEVQAQRPELVGNIQTTVDMARTAVTRVRPADADKAFALLTQLVDRYTGDG